MFPANPGIVTNRILQAPTVQSVRICTGEPADGVDIFPKKLGCMACQSKFIVVVHHRDHHDCLFRSCLAISSKPRNTPVSTALRSVSLPGARMRISRSLETVRA